MEHAGASSAQPRTLVCGVSPMQEYNWYGSKLDGRAWHRVADFSRERISRIGAGFKNDDPNIDQYLRVRVGGSHRGGRMSITPNSVQFLDQEGCSGRLDMPRSRQIMFGGRGRRRTVVATSWSGRRVGAPNDTIWWPVRLAHRACSGSTSAKQLRIEGNEDGVRRSSAGCPVRPASRWQDHTFGVKRVAENVIAADDALTKIIKNGIDTPEHVSYRGGGVRNQQLLVLGLRRVCTLDMSREMSSETTAEVKVSRQLRGRHGRGEPAAKRSEYPTVCAAARMSKARRGRNGAMGRNFIEQSLAYRGHDAGLRAATTCSP